MISTNFDVLLTVQFSIFISVINQLGAQNFCFTVSLFHASTCFEHMYCWLITEINNKYIFVKVSNLVLSDEN